MIERFEGATGAPLLMEAIADQGIVHGNQALAKELAAVSQLQELDADDVLIVQDRDDNDIYFVISGSLEVEANGNRVAVRGAKTHVGEMALIDPKALPVPNSFRDDSRAPPRLYCSAPKGLRIRSPEWWSGGAEQFSNFWAVG